MSDREHLNIPPEFSGDRPIIERYAAMLDEQTETFFDVDEFETIIDFFLSTYDTREASLAIERGLKQHPQSFDLKFRRAQVLLSNGEASKALSEIGALEMLEPRNPELMALHADVHLFREEFDKAIKLYLAALEHVHVEANPNLILSLALTYHSQGNLLDAISRLKEVLELDPANEYAIETLRSTYQQADLEQEGIRNFSDYCRMFPKQFEYPLQLAMLCSDCENYLKSEVYFNKALELRPSSPMALLGKAEILYHMDRYEEAIEVYETIVEPYELNAAICCGIGECYEQLHRPEKALEYYTKSLEDDSDYAEAHVGSAIVLDHMGKSESAIGHLRRAIQLEPDNHEFWHVQAEILCNMEQYESSALSFEQSLNLNTNDLLVYTGYLDMLILNGQVEKALEVVGKAFENMGNEIDFYCRAIKILTLLHRPAEVEQLIQMMLRDFPLGQMELLDYFPELKDYTDLFNFLQSLLNEQ